jgi:hypothetical protein
VELSGQPDRLITKLEHINALILIPDCDRLYRLFTPEADAQPVNTQPLCVFSKVIVQAPL